MKYLYKLPFLFVLGLVLLPSCGKQPVADADTVPVRVTFIPVQSAGATRASDLEQTPGEVAVNTLDVFVFRADGTGLLDARRSASESEIESRTLSLSVPVGDKDVYLIANMPEALKGVSSESALKEAVLSLADNSRESFVMVGTPGKTVRFESGDRNDCTVTLRRIAARVSVRAVRTAFLSSAQERMSFRLGAFVLGDVRGSAPLVNGDVSDAFGAKENGHYLWPGAESDEGFLNRTALHPDWIESDPALRSLTTVDVDAAAPEAGEFEWEGRALMYMYPNPVTEGADVTKLVLCTELDEQERFYSFAIPDVQPNTAYTFTDITLTRPGRLFPSELSDTDGVSFNLFVSDWVSGEILGSYNGNNGYIVIR